MAELLLASIVFGIFISLIMLMMTLKKITCRNRAERDIVLVIKRFDHLLRHHIIPTLEYSQTSYPTDRDKERYVKSIFKSDHVLRRYYSSSIVKITVANRVLKVVISLSSQITITESLRQHKPLSTVG